MPSDDTQATESLAREIQSYLERHPAAADTAEGILMWWITRQRMTESLESVQRALDYLIAQHRIRADRRQDGAVIYMRPDDERMH